MIPGHESPQCRAEPRRNTPGLPSGWPQVSTRAALASCLSLGPGARLLAEAADGVVLLEEEAELRLGKQLNKWGPSCHPPPPASSSRPSPPAWQPGKLVPAPA